MNLENVERAKITKTAFWMKQNTLFIVFEGLSFGEKIKNSGHKLCCTSVKNFEPLTLPVKKQKLKPNWELN